MPGDLTPPPKESQIPAFAPDFSEGWGGRMKGAVSSEAEQLGQTSLCQMGFHSPRQMGKVLISTPL